jgi:type II pantothenate kinase
MDGGSSSKKPTAQPTSSKRGHHSRTHSLLRRGSLPPNFPGGTLNFVRFETEQIGDLILFLKDLIKQSAATNHVTEEEMKKGVRVIATGGGAHKYYDELVEGTGLSVQREEEMECLTTGLQFITSIPDEVFWYSDKLVYEISHRSTKEPSTDIPTDPTEAERKNMPRPSPDPPSYQVTFDSAASPQFPCLLVNIGSGVSIVKVDEDGSFERVSGTSLGGGTLWGLLSLITEATTFDGEWPWMIMHKSAANRTPWGSLEMLALSEKGDNAAVDMLVGDIYGSDYNKIGLKSSTIASSFGKVFKKGAADRKKAFSQEDISKSLLYAISNNIGQIA